MPDNVITPTIPTTPVTPAILESCAPSSATGA